MRLGSYHELGDGIQLGDSLCGQWKTLLGPEFSEPYLQQLQQFLREEAATQQIFPPAEQVFRALDMTAFEDVKVVILGQDPYHNDGQAQGLSFSVPKGTRVPPSLVNIFKEQRQDLGISQPGHGCLDSWATQGVLLLNSVLTVRAHAAASHQKQGWEPLTDRIIAHLNNRRCGLVFMLWGSYARRKGRFIDRDKHLVLESPHPSPLSAYRGFLGNQHFSKANAWLQQQGASPIDWQLPVA